jgi:hypothetical protein
VEWVCPTCHARASAAAPVIVTPAPMVAPTPPGPHVAPPAISAPTKTTDSAPPPGDLGAAEVR